MGMIKSFLNKLILPFIFRRGRVQPIKVFITILLSLIVWAVVDKIQSPERLGTDFIALLLGNLALLLGADVWRQNGKDKFNNQKDTTPTNG
jgi:hypothetical protein